MPAAPLPLPVKNIHIFYPSVAPSFALKVASRRYSVNSNQYGIHFEDDNIDLWNLNCYRNVKAQNPKEKLSVLRSVLHKGKCYVTM